MATTLSERLEQAAAGKRSLEFDPLANDDGRVVFILLDDIEPDPNQPRKDVGDLSELAASIKTHGVIQPIVVQTVKERKFRIIAGERRYRASRQAGLERIQAIIRTMEEQNLLEVQLIENLHRKDLNPLEEAGVYRRLMDEFGLTQEQMATRIGRSQPVINESLRLLNLPASIRDDYRTSDKVSKSLLLEIVKEPIQEQQTALWERAKAGQLTVREAREQKREQLPPSRQPSPRTVRTFATQNHITVIARSNDGHPLTRDRLVAVLESILSELAQEPSD